MSRKNSLFVILSTFLALSVSYGFASADDYRNNNPQIEKIRLAGTFLTSRIDANADGNASSWCTLQVRGGRQWSSMMQCVNEDVFVGTPPDCPGGLFVVNEIDGGTGTGTRTFSNAKDQIYFELTERDLCTDAFGQITGVDSGIIVGGVGRYVDATGTYELEYTGQILYFDGAAEPPQFFGSLIGKGKWVIHFPGQ